MYLATIQYIVLLAVLTIVDVQLSSGPARGRRGHVVLHEVLLVAHLQQRVVGAPPVLRVLRVVAGAVGAPRAHRLGRGRVTDLRLTREGDLFIYKGTTPASV